VWGVVLALTAVIAVVAAVMELSGQRREVAVMKAKLAEMQPNVKTAEASIARTTFAQRWNDQDPRFLRVLSDLAALSPGDGQVWASSLNVQDDGRVTLTGRGTRGEAVQAVLDRLRASRAFADMKVLDMRPAGRNSGEITFSVSVRVVPPGGDASTQASTQPVTPDRFAPATRATGRRGRR
jgi:hypothetical protein